MGGWERPRYECRKIAMVDSEFFGRDFVRRNFVRTADMPLPIG